MRARAWLEEAVARLEGAGVEPEEARLEGLILLEDLGGVSRARLPLDPPLGEEARAALAAALRRREGREPLSHILGEWEFWGLRFEVSRHTLTPRADTELLVEEGLRWLRSRPQLSSPWVVDACAGTGCVGLSLLSELGAGARASLTELSPEALAVAGRNEARLRAAGVVRGRVDLWAGDLLAPLRAASPPGAPPPDLVVSNPPYIRPADLAGLAPEVRDHEPRLALDGDLGAPPGDGLAVVRRLVAEARALLAPGGGLLLEVGWDQTEVVGDLLRAEGFEGVWRRRDYGGNWRVVGGVRGGKNKVANKVAATCK